MLNAEYSYMEKKKLMIISGGVLLAIVIASAVVWGVGRKNAPETETAATPTPTTALIEEEDDQVSVSLTKNKAGTAVTLTVAGLGGRYTGIEYELSYQTNKGPKGTLSGSKPIVLIEGQDEFERDIELGTCSTGGRCTYDTGVHNFKVTLRLHTPDGNARIVREEFEEV